MKTTRLESLNACRDAIIFSKQFKTPKEVWENCPRGDWMLWIAVKLKVNKRLLTLAKGKCAETVIHLMKDQRSKDAVKAAIDYGENRINDQELKIAYAAAYAAAADAAAAAYYAADAAARKNNQLLTANICRDILTKEVLLAYKKLKAK